MDLDIDCLRSFIAVSELSSFSKAALRRHRVQSAISWQIKKLEQQVGTSLFKRHSKGVSLTRAGKLFLKRACEIVEINEIAISELAGSATEQKVTIGTSDAFLASFVPRLLRSCRKSLPNLSIEVISGYSEQIWRSYSTGEIDIALTQNCPGTISSRLLLSSPMVWIAPNEHFCWEAEQLKIACFTTGCSDRSLITSALDNFGLKYEVAFSASSLAGVLSAVEHSFAISAIPYIALGEGVSILDNIGVLPKLGNVDISIAANYTNSGDPIRAVESAIIEFFAEKHGSKRLFPLHLERDSEVNTKPPWQVSVEG